MNKIIAIASSFLLASMISINFNFLPASAATEGSLIKINGISSVYYLDPAGQRHTFPSESVYFSWYSDFNQVVTIAPAELQSYPLSANVTMRPGTNLVKIITDPSVYAVEPGGVLRKIPSETDAINIYGSNWSGKVVDVPDSFFNNYTVGAPLVSSLPPAGAVVKSSDTKYFYFDGNKYRQIISATTFHANRFKTENIISVNKVISADVVGPVIASAENVLSDIHANNTAQGATSYNEVSANSVKNVTTTNPPVVVSPPVSSGGGGGGGGGSSGGGGGGGTTVIPADTIAPIISTFSIAASSSALTVPILNFIATDNVAVESYLLTETNNIPSAADSWINSVPTTYTFSEHGPRTLYAWSRDAKGNISSPVSKTVEITLPDTSIPLVSIFSVPVSSTSLTVPINNLVTSDNIGVTGYLITETDSKPLASASSWLSLVPINYTISAAGAKTLYAWAKDLAGNVSNYLSATVTVTLADLTAPQITSFSIPSTGTSLTVPVSTFTASDNLAVTGYLITESATKPTSGFTSSAPTSYVFSNGGSKTLYAWVKDAAGNISAATSASIIITIADTIKPNVTAFTIPMTATSLTVSISSFTATDNIGVTGYILTESSTVPTAGATWLSSAPTSYVFSTAGNKTLYAWVKDAASNISSSLSDAIIISLPDTTKPTVSSFSIPASSSSLTVSVSTFVATDNIAVTGYLLTETATEPMAGFGSWTTSAPNAYTFASSGNKTLYAWVKDAAGNISAVSSDSTTITLEVAVENTFYISTTGNDTTGNGSINSPWKSLYKACNSVTTSGKTIHVKAGTYIETLSCNLAVGVSIEGEGVTSVIKSHYTTPNTITISSAAISLVSSATGTTNGNQSISNLKLDGDNLQGSGGILVKKRSNVKVHDVTIVDFFKNGIAFWGPSAFNTGAGPFLYDDGNELYNSTISNCGDIPGDNVTYSGGGLILMTAQSNMLIHDNTLSEISRAQGHNGNIINAGGRHFKGVKYYNNKSYKPDNEGIDYNPVGAVSRPLPQGWNFHLEIWHTEGGIEIYGNEFHGGDCAVDVAGEYAKKGDYEYSYSIHDNLFTPISGHGGTGSYHGKDAITIEAFYTEDVLIYDNHFLNFPITIEIGDEPTHYCEMKRIHIYNNLMENTGYGSGMFNSIIAIQVERVGNITSDIFFHNNTIVSDPTGRTMAFAVQVGNADVPGGGTLNNLNIKNNIMAYHTNASPIFVTNNGAINGLHIENNLSYNLNNYNVAPYFRPSNTGALSDYTYLNNIPVSNTTQQNPLFVSASNFHLQATSPAINKGVNVGLPFNGTAPDIGRFEY